MMDMLRHPVVACLLLAAAQLPASPEASNLPRGQVIEKVICRTNPAQNYALYLPSRYSPDRQWPILYAFDAGARGGLPVERFREAAEQYGYVVAGSNNSRNGPMTIADEALRAMVGDTQARLSLDPKRVYATGFSGGARVASLAGTALQAAGVIGCGAGFHPAIQPSSSLPFAYFAAVGTGDFNYPELVQLDETLARLDLPHRIEVFEGDHEWPPPAVCTRAIEWMELQAIRKSGRPADASLVDAILSGAVGEAAADERAGRLFPAFERYSAIAKDFTGLRDVAPFEAKAKQLASSKAVKSALADRRASIELQRTTESRLQGLVEQARSVEDRPIAVQALVAEFSELRRQANGPRDDVVRMVARRVLTSAWVQQNAAVADELERGDTARVVTRLELMAHIRPENYRVDYLLARVLARTGKKRAAIEALRTAVKKGFSDVSALESERDFAALAGEDGFRAVVARLRTPGTE